MSKKIVLALGGNALGDDLAGQMKAVKITSQAIVDLIAQGHEVIVTHGNGPQVGMINQAFEAAAKTEAHSPMLPMSVCVALSQGYIGYDLQNALREELLSRGINKPVATLVTQVEVDANDPAFLNPTKPIGSFFTEQEAEQLTKQGYTLKEDAGLAATKQDIVDNPYNVDIQEIEAAGLPATLDSADFSVINGNYAIPAGLNVNKDALAYEENTSEAAQTFANIVAVKEGNENSEKIQALVKALTSDEVKTYIEEKYEGAVVPIF